MFRSLTAIAIGAFAALAPAVAAEAVGTTRSADDDRPSTIVVADPGPVTYSPIGLYVAQVAVLDCLDQLDPEAPCRWE